MNSVILVMSLTGSGMYLLYLLLKPLLKKYFSVGLRIRFLLASVMFFIIPLPLIKNFYYDLICKVYDFNSVKASAVIKIKNPIQILPDNTVIMPKVNIFVATVFILWLLIVIIRFVLNYKTYNNLKKSLLSESAPCTNNSINKIIEAYQRKLNVKRNITVLISDKSSILTLCFIKPIIILNNNLDSNQIEYIIEHELQHIYYKDFIIKILLLIMSIIHFFNPLVYLISLEIKKLLEYRSDESIVINMNTDERKSYGNAIIDISTENNKHYKLNNMPISSFGSDNYKDMKERINEMKKVKKHNKINYILSVIILTVSVISSSMLVFAYEDYSVSYLPENHVNISSENSENIVNANICTIPEDINDQEETDDILPFTNETQILIIDEDGNIYPFEGDVEPYALCNHTYINVTITEHYKFSDGSCRTDYYSGQRCTKCNTVVYGTFVKSVNYTVCPH